MDCLTWLQEEYFHIATDVIDFDNPIFEFNLMSYSQSLTKQLR